jgi:hypothetical protein
MNAEGLPFLTQLLQDSDLVQADPVLPAVRPSLPPLSFSLLFIFILPFLTADFPPLNYSGSHRISSRAILLYSPFMAPIGHR